MALLTARLRCYARAMRAHAGTSPPLLRFKRERDMSARRLSPMQ